LADPTETPFQYIEATPLACTTATWVKTPRGSSFGVPIWLPAKVVPRKTT
jgi:hypothetical protein